MEERDFSIVAICGQESVRKVLPRTLLQGGDWREKILCSQLRMAFLKPLIIDAIESLLTVEY